MYGNIKKKRSEELKRICPDREGSLMKRKKWPLILFFIILAAGLAGSFLALRPSTAGRWRFSGTGKYCTGWI